MIRFIFILTLTTLTFAGRTQNELKKNWYKGNVFYENAEFEDAVYYYQQAVANSPLNFKSNYN
ncbi:hypothetical protein N8987_06660, partial [Crocinitomix sp.]|nr:hypothetical protein [Crocinitomix sp.]